MRGRNGVRFLTKPRARRLSGPGVLQPPGNSGSHRTPWREVDSNLRSLSRIVADLNRWPGNRHRVSEGAFPLRRDRWFESGSLQRGVRCEPEFSRRLRDARARITPRKGPSHRSKSPTGSSS